MPESLREDLRKSFVCDCGPERHEIARARITLPMLGDDKGEQVFEDVKEATSSRPHTCPWQSLRSAFVREVIHAYGPYKSQQLTLLYPDPAAVLVDGLIIFDSALDGVRAADLRRDRKEREENNGHARDVPLGAGGFGSPARAPRGRRPRAR